MDYPVCGIPSSGGMKAIPPPASIERIPRTHLEKGTLLKGRERNISLLNKKLINFLLLFFINDFYQYYFGQPSRFACVLLEFCMSGSSGVGVTGHPGPPGHPVAFSRTCTLSCFKRPPNQKSALRIVRYDTLTHMEAVCERVGCCEKSIRSHI